MSLRKLAMSKGNVSGHRRSASLRLSHRFGCRTDVTAVTAKRARRVGTLSLVGNQVVANPQQWNARETALLNEAVEKMVRIGELVGISPGGMIVLLDAGMSIRDLLLFLTSKDSDSAA